MKYYLAAAAVVLGAGYYLRHQAGAMIGDALSSIADPNNPISQGSTAVYQTVTGSTQQPGADLEQATHDPDTGRPAFDWYDPRYWAIRSLDRVTGADEVYK